MSETQNCVECGEPLTPEEIADPFCPDGGDAAVCFSCEVDNYWEECSICCESNRAECLEKAIAVFEPDDAFRDEGKPAGFYRILGKPYYMQGLVGSGWLLEDRIQFASPLPEKKDGDGYPCGVVCDDCFEKYVGKEDKAA